MIPPTLPNLNHTTTLRYLIHEVLAPCGIIPIYLPTYLPTLKEYLPNLTARGLGL